MKADHHPLTARLHAGKEPRGLSSRTSLPLPSLTRPVQLDRDRDGVLEDAQGREFRFTLPNGPGHLREFLAIAYSDTAHTVRCISCVSDRHGSAPRKFLGKA